MADASMDYVVCVDVIEHVVDLDQVIGEARRVLRPGGMFLFDTINRTWLAILVVVFFSERIFRILPAGTHDPAKFIKPKELAAKLVTRRALPYPILWAWVLVASTANWISNAVPSTSIMYMGHATLDDPEVR